MTSVDFFKRVEKRGPNDCWLWTGITSSDGYGRVYFYRKWNGKRTTGAHRYILHLLGRPAPSNLLVCHHCDTPNCVNPRHLFIGTHTDNMRDCSRKGRINPENQRKATAARAKLPYPNGEENKRAILTNEQVIRILRTPKRRGYIAELARQLKASWSTVWNVASGRKWKHIPRQAPLK